MITFLGILTFISLIITNLGIVGAKDNVTDTGLTMFGIVVIVGWLFIGIIANIYDTERIIVPIIKQTEISITVTDSTEREFVFDKQIDFNNITDTTTFHLIKSTNMYHFNTSYELYYKIGNSKFKSN